MKSRWGNSPIDTSSSMSHLVESAETPSSLQAPSVPPRSSPFPPASTHSSYRQAPSSIASLSYRQASALPGFRPLVINQENNDNEEGSPNIFVNRSRLTTPLGSRKSLSESIQSLRSNQQPPSLSLPMKKRSHPPPLETKNEFADHHYQNPADLRKKRATNSSSEEESEAMPSNGKQPDEAPPSYQQVAQRSSPASNAFVYHEPTEV